jgi:hypothetical protein
MPGDRFFLGPSSGCIENVAERAKFFAGGLRDADFVSSLRRDRTFDHVYRSTETSSASS